MTWGCALRPLRVALDQPAEHISGSGDVTCAFHADQLFSCWGTVSQYAGPLWNQQWVVRDIGFGKRVNAVLTADGLVHTAKVQIAPPISSIDVSDVDALVERWVAEAGEQEELHPNVPLARLVLEGFELACFIEHYWEPNEALGLPGLKEYVRAQFTQTLANDIRELSLAVAHLQGRFNADVPAPVEAPVERGEQLLSELGRALTFLFDDGVETVEDQELQRIKQSFSDKKSHDALALSLEGIAYYANKQRKRLKTLPHFDDGIIDEALAVAHRLRSQSGLKKVDDARPSARTDRARVTRLLHDRMNIARRTIRYAFAHQPEVVQRATSQYRRERRQKWREKRRADKSQRSSGAEES